MMAHEFAVPAPAGKVGTVLVAARKVLFNQEVAAPKTALQGALIVGGAA
jgi:hypothetical protein